MSDLPNEIEELQRLVMQLLAGFRELSDAHTVLTAQHHAACRALTLALQQIAPDRPPPPFEDGFQLFFEFMTLPPELRDVRRFHTDASFSVAEVRALKEKADESAKDAAFAKDGHTVFGATTLQ